MRKLGVNCQFGSTYTKCLSNSFRTCKYSYHLDELADIALQSESDSVRDECSSGIRSEAEDEAAVTSDSRPPRPSARSKPGLGQAPAHLSLSSKMSGLNLLLTSLLSLPVLGRVEASHWSSSIQILRSDWLIL